MKKLALFIIFAFTLQATLLSQECFPEGIYFSTQADIDNFQANYPGCTEIEGFVFIGALGAEIFTLSGLDVLTSIGGGLLVMNNSSLTNLNGLENITSIGDGIVIAHNDALTSLTGLSNLTSNVTVLYIHDNKALISLTGLENLTEIEDNLTIERNNALTTLMGLNNVTSVGEQLWIIENNALTSLAGLDNLISIGGGLQFNNNDFLTNILALNHLTSVGAYLSINSNDALTNLSGLNNLTAIGGKVKISRNDKLISLAGLDYIAAASIEELYIRDNTSLSSCAVLSVCNYLASPGCDINIQDNAIGCNSINEVEDDCGDLSISEKHNKPIFSIYPNPAKDYIIISHNINLSNDKLVIYNQMGQKVFEEEFVGNTFDVSKLQQGMYVIEIRTNEFMTREKLIVNE